MARSDASSAATRSRAKKDRARERAGSSRRPEAARSLVRLTTRSRSRAPGLHRRDLGLDQHGPHAWALPRGKRLRVGVPHGHWKTTTFVAGLTARGMVAPFVLDGPINRIAFRGLCREGPRPRTRRRHRRDGQPRQPQGPTSAPIEAAGASLLYLPPYSPDFNPIEKAFAKLKALLRKAAERTVDGLWTAIGRFLDLFTPTECANYFAAAGYDATDRILL